MPLDKRSRASDNPPHPIQPTVTDEHGTLRFKQNALVRYLLDAGPFDLNHLAVVPNVPAEDYEQFAQLIGYSLSGFSELSYVRDETYEAATHMADKGLSELQARLVYLEGMVAMLRDKLRKPMADLFSVHPDDLKG